MKDVSDGSLGCSSDHNDKALPDLPNLDQEKSIASHCEECHSSRPLAEPPHTWGDFEEFNEFTPPSQQFYYADEALQLNSFTAFSDEGHGAEETDAHDGWCAFNKEDNVHTTDCEQMFKQSFPAPSAEETIEDVKSLDAVLAFTSNEGNVVSQLLKSRFWPDCDPLEKVLTPACDWKSLKGCRDLMSLLSICAENRSVNRKEITERTENFDVDQSQVHESLHNNANKALIQTKLDVAPGSKQGHIFSYQLFLKKPSNDVPISFLNFSGKKNFFSTNQIRFNF